MANGVAGQLKCTIVTPERKVTESPADFVVLTAHDGQVGILPERSAMLCRLMPGLLRIDQGQKKEFYYVAGGFAEVLDNRITVLTPEAIQADKLLPETVRNELAEVGKLPAATENERQKRQKALDAVRGKESTLAAYQKKD